MIYSIAILVKSLELKKSMKELDYSPSFWSKVYWDFNDFPKKFGGLGAPSLMICGTPKMPYFGHLGGPGYHSGWGPQTPKFFWEVNEVPIDFAPKTR